MMAVEELDSGRHMVDSGIAVDLAEAETVLFACELLEVHFAVNLLAC